MSKVKYRVREFSPKANQGGTHSFFAEDMLTPDLLSWTLGATIGINRWSSESRAKRLAA